MKTAYDIQKIMEFLPHRYPFLLVDRILELEPGVRVKAIKNVTSNEPHFMGHFPGYAIMPGVLIVEALAQAVGTIVSAQEPHPETKLLVFTGIQKARFRQPVSHHVR